MNDFTKALRSNAARAIKAVRQGGQKVAMVCTGMVASGAAMASTTTTTTQDVTALIESFKTDGVLIAGGLTLAIFMVAAAKWLRRAK